MRRRGCIAQRQRYLAALYRTGWVAYLLWGYIARVSSSSHYKPCNFCEAKEKALVRTLSFNRWVVLDY